MGNSFSALAFTTYSGIFHINIAPSVPTDIIVLWSGEIAILVIPPECPFPLK